MKYITIILFSLMLLTCDNIRDKKKVSKSNNLYIEISVSDNRSNSNQIEGNIKYYFKMSDTLKIINKDKRLIYFTADVKSHKENESIIKNNTVFEEELSFSKIILNDTVSVPFSFKGEFKGKLIIFGGISDNFFLNSYKDNEGKIRVVSYEHIFKQEVDNGNGTD